VDSLLFLSFGLVVVLSLPQTKKSDQSDHLNRDFLAKFSTRAESSVSDTL